MHTIPKNVFEQFDDERIITLEPDDRFYPYRLCWDCEVYFDTSELPNSTDRLEFHARHRLASISLVSNVPGYEEAITLVSEGDERDVVFKAMDYMVEVSTKAGEIMMERYENEYAIIEMLEEAKLELERMAVQEMCHDDEVLRDKLLNKCEDETINVISC